MRHPKAEAWEETLRGVFAKINDYLEARYGHLYPLHPARPPHGATSDGEADGLFELGASFTAGIGSEHGPGYVVELRFATLSHVDKQTYDRIESEAIERLKEELPKAFPSHSLVLRREGPMHKIVGDLHLGLV